MLCLFFWNKSLNSKTLNPAFKLTLNHLKGFAPLSSSIDSKTGESVVISSISGEIIPPCNDGGFLTIQGNDYQKKASNKKSTKIDCAIKVVDPSPELRSAIEGSNSVIKGSLLKNGKKINAVFYSSITAVYSGSICHTHQIGGIQRTFCPTESNFCFAMYNGALGAKAAGVISDDDFGNIEDQLESMGCGNFQP